MRFTTLILLLLSAAVFTGCGGANNNPFGAVYLEGMVTLDGSPVEGVGVTLIPRNGNFSAGGITNTYGKFTVTTGGSGHGTGAKPGEYDVVFSKNEFPPPRQLPSVNLAPNANPSTEGDKKKNENRRQEPVRLIPKRYESPKTSGIAPITVDTDKKKNSFTFELTTK